MFSVDIFQPVVLRYWGANGKHEGNMYLNKSEDIESVLILTHIQDVPLTLKPRGVGRTFSSAFVEIAAEEDNTPVLLIKRLDPEIGNDIVSYSKSVNITFSLPGSADQQEPTTYTFNAHFIREDVFEGEPVLRVSFPERRRFNRVEPRQGEQIRVTVHRETDDFDGFTMNISEGGIAFFAPPLDEPLQEKGQVVVSFMLPAGSGVHSMALVRWVSSLDQPRDIEGGQYSALCGVEFEELDEQMRMHLKHYVHEREQEELQKIIDDDSLWTAID